jgi:hypothetical protein
VGVDDKCVGRGIQQRQAARVRTGEWKAACSASTAWTSVQGESAAHAVLPLPALGPSGRMPWREAGCVRSGFQQGLAARVWAGLCTALCINQANTRATWPAHHTNTITGLCDCERVGVQDSCVGLMCRISRGFHQGQAARVWDGPCRSCASPRAGRGGCMFCTSPGLQS